MSYLKSFPARFLCLFLVFTLFFPLPVPAIESPVPQTPFEIPSKFGALDEFLPGNPQKTLIYIQDAHGSLEAQLNMAKIISHLVENEGVKTVYEEGYEGPVPTDDFFGFIDNPEKRQNVSYFFLDRLRLGGTEYAHINRTKDFKLIGVDSSKLHELNNLAYQKAASRKKRIKAELGVLNAEIERLIQTKMPKNVKEWLKLRTRLDENKISLLDYLSRLTTAHEDLFKSGHFPIMKNILEAAVSRDPNAVKRIKGLEGRKFFEELQNFETSLNDHLVQDPVLRQLLHYWKIISLFSRLSDLSISSGEYDAVSKELSNFDNDAMAGFIAKETGKSIVIPRRWQKDIKLAVSFYETARQRDDFLELQLKAFSESEEDKTVLTFGGFHKNAIREIAKKNNWSCLILSPRISSVDTIHQKFYEELMTRGPYDFEQAPKVEASRVFSVMRLPDGEKVVRDAEKVISGLPQGQFDSELAARLIDAYLTQASELRTINIYGAAEGQILEALAASRIATAGRDEYKGFKKQERLKTQLKTKARDIKRKADGGEFNSSADFLVFIRGFLKEERWAKNFADRFTVTPPDPFKGLRSEFYLKDEVLKVLAPVDQQRIHVAAEFVPHALAASKLIQSGKENEVKKFDNIPAAAIVKWLRELAAAGKNLNSWNAAWMEETAEFVAENHTLFEDLKVTDQFNFRLYYEVYLRRVERKIKVPDSAFPGTVKLFEELLLEPQSWDVSIDALFTNWETAADQPGGRVGAMFLSLIDRISLIAQLDTDAGARAVDFLTFFMKKALSEDNVFSRAFNDVFLFNRSLVEDLLSRDQDAAVVYVLNGSAYLHQQAMEIAGAKNLDSSRIYALPLSRRMLNRYKSNPEILINYFRDKGLFKHKRLIVVDTGYKASIGLAVDRLLTNVSGAPQDIYMRLLSLQLDTEENHFLPALQGTPLPAPYNGIKVAGWNELIQVLDGQTQSSVRRSRSLASMAYFLDVIASKSKKSSTRLDLEKTPYEAVQEPETASRFAEIAEAAFRERTEALLALNLLLEPELKSQRVFDLWEVRSELRSVSHRYRTTNIQQEDRGGFASSLTGLEREKILEKLQDNMKFSDFVIEDELPGGLKLLGESNASIYQDADDPSIVYKVGRNDVDPSFQMNTNSNPLVLHEAEALMALIPVGQQGLIPELIGIGVTKDGLIFLKLKTLPGASDFDPTVFYSLSAIERIDYVLGIAKALQEVHRLKWIQNDVARTNFLLRISRRKNKAEASNVAGLLIDFGHARYLKSAEGVYDMTRNSSLYWDVPETMRSPASDIFEFAYFLNQWLKTDAEKVPELKKIIAQMGDKDPKKRPAIETIIEVLIESKNELTSEEFHTTTAKTQDLTVESSDPSGVSAYVSSGRRPETHLSYIAQNYLVLENTSSNEKEGAISLDKEKFLDYVLAQPGYNKDFSLWDAEQRYFQDFIWGKNIWVEENRIKIYFKLQPGQKHAFLLWDKKNINRSELRTQTVSGKNFATVIFVNGSAQTKSPQEQAAELAVLASRNSRQTFIVYQAGLLTSQPPEFTLLLQSFRLKNVKFANGDFRSELRRYQNKPAVNLTHYSFNAEAAVQASQESGNSSDVIFIAGEPGALSYGLKHLNALQLKKQVDDVRLINGVFEVDPNASAVMKLLQDQLFSVSFSKSA